MIASTREKLFRFVTGGLIFAGVFLSLQYLYFSGENSTWRQFFIEKITLTPVIELIHLIAPQQQVDGAGGSIVTPGFRLSLRTGCDGADAMILLVAAFAAAGLGWKHTVLGVAGGLVLIFVFNQLRIAALFFAFGAHRAWFDLLHGFVGPILLIVATGLYFLWCLQCSSVSVREATKT